MRSRFQFTRPSRRTMIIGAIVLGSLLVYGLTRINYQCDWTGFGICDFVEGSDEDYRPEKTLWDWLGLLIVPTVLALGAIYFNLAERRNELEIAQQERRNESRIAEERAQDARLQTYLDQMRELLLDRNLRDSQAGNEVRHVAQTLTLIALRRLDRERRNILMQFLRSSQLIGLHEAQGLVDTHGNPLGVNARNIVDFQQVDLSEADLSFIPLFLVNLTDSNFQGANLIGANLTGANLTGANLTRADLIGANLTGANLTGANLTRANLIVVDLGGASLSGADLTRANLERADLHGADLHGADLHGADLQWASLTGANLQWASLTGANLTRADLQGAILDGANVTPEQLAQARSLTGATMPDGSIHD
jgi:uncharacterized protein YjbI with pentapeptide repeats